MWSTVKATFTVIGRNIPVGVGIGIGAGIGGAVLATVGKGLLTVSKNLDNKLQDRKDKKAMEMAERAAAAGATA